MVMVCEGPGHMLVGMVLHRGHSAVRMGEERVGGGSGGLAAVGGAKRGVSAPWRLVVHLAWMSVGGELVGNARGLLRIEHGIGGESRHSGRREGGEKEEKKEERKEEEKVGKERKEGESTTQMTLILSGHIVVDRGEANAYSDIMTLANVIIEPED